MIKNLFVFSICLSFIVNIAWAQSLDDALKCIKPVDSSSEIGCHGEVVKALEEIVEDESTTTIAVAAPVPPKKEIVPAKPKKIGCHLVNPSSYFSGGKNSPLACIVGMSEGNRTSSCGYRSTWYGHTDPGNGKYNVGSFSRNGTSMGPVAADNEWLGRLKSQYPTYKKKVEALGMDPTNAIIFFNYMDLYTQSPDAATGWNDTSRGLGFLGNLKTLKGKTITWDNIVTVRTKSYYNTKGRKESVFSVSGLKHDQSRRVKELKKGVIGKSGGIKCQ